MLASAKIATLGSDILTGDELKPVNKYVLSKDELERPRELSQEEQDRIAFRRRAGWSLFNPALDLKKRDVVQHIQNPIYRAGLDVAGSGLVGTVGGVWAGHHMSKLMGMLGQAKTSPWKDPRVLMGLAGAIPAMMGTHAKYKRQLLYNDIAEEYVKHHNEGGIESMPTVLNAMTEKAKKVNSMQRVSRKIKTGGIQDRDYMKSPEVPEFNMADLGVGNIEKKLKQIQTAQKYMNVFSAGNTAWKIYNGYKDNRKAMLELDDLRERFQRKLQTKADADIFVTKVKTPLYRKNVTQESKIDALEDMFKQSADSSPLLPHQQRVIDKLSKPDQPGLILMHGLGSGKTRSSIEAYKHLGLGAEVVLPAALGENYKKEMHKWLGKEPKNVNIRSQQEIARNGANPENFKDKLMVIDEAHRLRNEDSKGYKALKAVNPAKRLLLTGTPIYNHPSDIAKLINLASGKQLMPERQPEFEKEYIQAKTVFPSLVHRILGVSPGQELSVKNKDYLRAVFHKMIDYHGGNAEGMPTTTDEVVRVPMHEKQQRLYKAMMKELPWYLRMKVNAGLPPDRKELDKLIPFLSGARMISNSTNGFDKDLAGVVSPKVEQAFNFLKGKIDEDPTYKGLVYSNYLKSGVDPYKALLQKNNIPFGEFTGEMNHAVRNQMVRDYNANKLKALLVSSAGGEGLDLKGTRLVQLLEPHFNNEKIKQVIGRAARYKSHEALDPDKRNVTIQHYLSSLNPGMIDRLRGRKPTSTDEYLQTLSDDKERLNNEFIKLIKE
jgi:superfamily II DNA or RNA helicase